jgi:general secretion pathway protein B
MSFILDALKKSETDRQRQNGPALFEVRVAPPRDKLPLWAVGLGVLLAVNLVIVAWVLLRRPAPAEAATPPATVAMQPAPPPSYPAPAPYMGTQQGQPLPSAPNAVPVNGAPPTAPVAQTAMTQPMAQQAPSGAGTAPGAGSATPAAQPSAMPPAASSPSGTINTAPVADSDQQGTGGEAGDKLNPDDYAPAAEPQRQPFGNHVSRGTVSGVPLYADVASTNHLPSLRLDLHVYAANPQERFVMINMHKLREGDALPTEGVRVESITPYGAVLTHDGTRFVLPRD